MGKSRYAVNVFRRAWFSLWFSQLKNSAARFCEFHRVFLRPYSLHTISFRGESNLCQWRNYRRTDMAPQQNILSPASTDIFAIFVASFFRPRLFNPHKKNRGDALRCFCPWAPRTLDTPVTCVHLEAVAAVANAQLTSQDPTRQDCVSYHRAAVWTLDCVGNKWATEGNFVRKLFSRPTNTYAYPIECSTCTTKLPLRAKTVSMNITVFTRRKKRFMRSICIFDIKYAENSNSLPVFCGQQHRLRKHRWLTCFLLQCTKYDKLYCLLYFVLILLLFKKITLQRQKTASFIKLRGFNRSAALATVPSQNAVLCFWLGFGISETA